VGSLTARAGGRFSPFSADELTQDAAVTLIPLILIPLILASAIPIMFVPALFLFAIRIIAIMTFLSPIAHTSDSF
jgi:hypothetical protein